MPYFRSIRHKRKWKWRFAISTSACAELIWKRYRISSECIKRENFWFRETARKFCFIFPLKIYALLPMHIFVTIINQIFNWENENNWNAFKNENKRQESKPKSKKNLHKFYSCTQLYANQAHPNIPYTKDYRTNLYW